MTIQREDWSGGESHSPPATGTALVPAQNTGIDTEILGDARRALSSGYWTPDELRRHYKLSDQEFAALTPQRTTLAFVDRELAAIDKLRRTDRREYNNRVDLQHRERVLLEQRRMLASDPGKTAATPGHDLAVIRSHYGDQIIAEWTALHGRGADWHVKQAQENIHAAYEDLEQAERDQLQDSFDRLPQGARTECIRWLAMDAAAWRPADESYIKSIADLEPAFADLIKSWGRDAPKMVGRARGRSKMMLEQMTRSDRQAAEQFFERLPGRQAAAVIKGLAGRRAR